MRDGGPGPGSAARDFSAAGGAGPDSDGRPRALLLYHRGPGDGGAPTACHRRRFAGGGPPGRGPDSPDELHVRRTNDSLGRASGAIDVLFSTRRRMRKTRAPATAAQRRGRFLAGAELGSPRRPLLAGMRRAARD